MPLPLQLHLDVIFSPPEPKYSLNLSTAFLRFVKGRVISRAAMNTRIIRVLIRFESSRMWKFLSTSQVGNRACAVELA